MHISISTKQDYIIAISITVISSMLLLVILSVGYGHIKPVNYADAFVMGSAFAGTYLLLKHKLENWIFLNISNLVAIPLFIYKGLYLTTILYLIFFILAVLGYMRWRKLRNSQKQFNSHVESLLN